MAITGFPPRFFNRRGTCQLPGQHAAGNGKADLELIGLAQDIPIGRQRILLAPEHDPNICSVVPGGIEVRVVTCRGKSREPLSDPDGPGQRRGRPKDWSKRNKVEEASVPAPPAPRSARWEAWAMSTHPQHVLSQSSARNAHRLASLKNCFQLSTEK